MSRPVLLLAPDLAGDPALPALQERLRQRGAASATLDAAPTPRVLLAAMRTADADPARSWLATRDPAHADAAGTAGVYGVVVVGPGDDRDDGVLLRHSPDIAGISIAMVPRTGGCWH